MCSLSQVQRRGDLGLEGIQGLAWFQGLKGDGLVSWWLLLVLMLVLMLGWPFVLQAKEAQVLTAHTRPDQDLIQACTLCHGAEGRSTPYGYFPRLAGKPETYLYNQLLSFQAGRRHYAQMSNLLEQVNAPYLQKLAHYFATQDLPYPPPPKYPDSQATLDKGRQLALEGQPARQLAACTECHGPSLTGGVSGSIPGLLGLPRDYVMGQLGAWRNNNRQAQAPDCMAQVAKALTLEEVSAVSAWLSSQPWPKAGPATSKALQTRAASESLAKRCGSARAASSPTAVGEESRASKGLKELKGSKESSEQEGQPGSELTDTERRGRYLTLIGNCQACHTAPGGVAMAGGKAIETPFGRVYSSNLTPHASTGLGGWSAQDFWQALHEGRSKNGRHLLPAFPYTELTLVSRADSDAMFAYLQTLAPQNALTPAHTLRWPFNTAWGLRLWRTFYFQPRDYAVDAAQSQDWNRGAYLVNGLMHCGACHTPRNALGASRSDAVLGGAPLVAQGGWYAPSLMNPQDGGVQNWSTPQVQHLLRQGITPQGYVSGPMAEVVFKGGQYLSDADALAVSVYLRSLKGPTPVKRDQAQALEPSAKEHQAGQALYEKHCAGCHGKDGAGRGRLYPSLVDNRHVTSSQINNLVLTVMRGGIPPTTRAHSDPLGMPPFRAILSDSELAQVLTFMRSAWGHRAPSVSSLEVMQVVGPGP